jgi:long-chain acyl-CoA synthetase
VNKGSKVAICSENRPEWAYALLGAWAAGAIVVPIDYMSVASDIAYILDDCRPEVIFHSKDCAEAVREGVGQVEGDYHPSLLGFDDLTDTPMAGKESLPAFDPQETALIMYTSGTTGGPKGVMLSFDNLLANIEAVTEYSRIYTRDHRVMQLLPSHHILPLMGTILAPLSVGATIVICPKISSEAILETLQRHAITIMVGVPRLYSMMAGG